MEALAFWLGLFVASLAYLFFHFILGKYVFHPKKQWKNNFFIEKMKGY